MEVDEVNTQKFEYSYEENKDLLQDPLLKIINELKQKILKKITFPTVEIKWIEREIKLLKKAYGYDTYVKEVNKKQQEILNTDEKYNNLKKQISNIYSELYDKKVNIEKNTLTDSEKKQFLLNMDYETINIDMNLPNNIIELWGFTNCNAYKIKFSLYNDSLNVFSQCILKFATMNYNRYFLTMSRYLYCTIKQFIETMDKVLKEVKPELPELLNEEEYLKGKGVQIS